MNVFIVSASFTSSRKLSAVFCLFLLIQTVAFSLPPIRSENPDNTRTQLIGEADKYLGVPYRYGGISTQGLDCSGLIFVVFKNVLNISVPRTAYGLYSWAEKIDTGDLQPGDLVFFNTTGSVSHVGIYAGQGKFIHSASAGNQTGVNYSSLDESYWKRTYISAGRAISKGSGNAGEGVSGGVVPDIQIYETTPTVQSQNNNSRFSFSLGGAVSWNNYVYESSAIRGAGFQIGAAYALTVAGMDLKLGMELRPEWDIRLGVFRLPLTLSFGGDKFRAFLGPVLSTGNPVMAVPEGKLYLDGGTSWAGEAGITWAPFAFKTSTGKLAVYGELAWQFYYPESGQDSDWMANLSAATRISTGIRYTFGK